MKIKGMIGVLAIALAVAGCMVPGAYYGGGDYGYGYGGVYASPPSGCVLPPAYGGRIWPAEQFGWDPWFGVVRQKGVLVGPAGQGQFIPTSPPRPLAY